MVDAKVKGSAVLPSIAYVEENFGEKGMKKVLDKLSKDAKNLIESRIVLSGWYDVKLFEEFMLTADKVLGNGDYELIYQMGRFSASYGLSTIYKFFFKIGSPEFIIKKGSHVWKMYYSSGRLEIVELRKGHCILRLYDFGYPSKAFCTRITGWMEKTLEMCGAKNSKLIHSKCTARGDRYCEWVGKWD